MTRRERPKLRYMLAEWLTPGPEQVDHMEARRQEARDGDRFLDIHLNQVWQAARRARRGIWKNNHLYFETDPKSPKG